MTTCRLAALAALVLSLLPAPAAGAAPPAPRVDLAGPWRYLPHDGAGELCGASVDDRAWATMQLPSSWFLLGRREYPRAARAEGLPRGEVDTGALPDPEPARGLDYSGTVYFRRTVRVDLPPASSGERLLLDLDMVDYYTEAFVNGVPVGRHEGYFQRFAFDVTRALRPGDNLICLRVAAPAQLFDPAEEHPRGWPRRQDQIKGIFAYHDVRPGGSGPRGQSRSTGGVLRGVSLVRSSGVEIAALSVTPLSVSTERARLLVEATVRSRGGAARRATLEAAITADNFPSNLRVPLTMAVALPAGAGEARVRTEVELSRPALWWTWDRGRPDLHRLSARLLDGPRLLDERSERFGVRSIERDANWVFRLNGQRLYLRGTNYIATQWLSQADRPFYDRDLRLMKEAHLNTLRVHAHVARPELYDAADEAGLLVWQDFPLQWGYAEDAAFRDEALRQSADMIEQLRNHPSIGVFCMHNEAPHAMGWMKRRQPDQNLALDEALLSQARRLDPSRVIQRDSGTGDGHYYFGWYHDKAGTLRPLPAHIAPLVTEYGAQALPTRALLERMLPVDARWPARDEEWAPWRYLNFQPNFTFEVARVERGADLDGFIARSQAYQAALVRFQTEVLRRAKWTRSTGLYQFMFVDPWPAVSWSVLDYDRQPKLGYQALRSSMQRVLPSIEFQIDDPAEPLVLHVVSDDPVARPGALVSWRLVDERGAALSQGERRVDLPADSVVRVVELGALPAIAAGKARLAVEVRDAGGGLLGESALGAADFVPSPGATPRR